MSHNLAADQKFLLPAIDLCGGQVVRLYKGDYAKQTTYGSDPVAQAKLFEAAGATWLHVVDLDGAKSGKMEHLEVVRAICRETKLKVEVGGGVRTTEAVDQLLSAGVSRAIIGTAALRNWAWFETLAKNFAYAQKLVLGLDAHDGQVAVSGWEETTGTLATDLARKVKGWPLAAIIYTDIATDGTLQGPNLEATRAMCAATDVPVIASGGVGTLAHLRQLRGLPVAGAIIGKSLYEGCFTIEQALAALEK